LKVALKDLAASLYPSGEDQAEERHHCIQTVVAPAPGSPVTNQNPKDNIAHQKEEDEYKPYSGLSQHPFVDPRLERITPL
jgi:hypothetical protein